MSDLQLMVELIRAAELGTPDREGTDSKLDSNETSFECNAMGYKQLGIGIAPAEQIYLASGYSPPDPLLIPIEGLQGFVTHDYGRLYTSCTRESGTITLKSSVRISPPTDGQRTPRERMAFLRDPEARLAMARVMVDMTNKARDRFGCSESALPLPTDLPAIPRVGPPRNPKEYYKEHPPPSWCDPGVSGGWHRSSPADMQPWAMHTPQPSSLITTCEIREGAGLNPGEVPGRRKRAFVTYKGVLAQARHDSDTYSMPRYDIRCHGEPISYRLFVDDPNDSGDRLTQLPDSADYRERLEAAASSAAERAGCALPEK